MLGLANDDKGESGKVLPLEREEEVAHEGDGLVGVESVEVERHLRTFLDGKSSFLRKSRLSDDAETDSSSSVVTSDLAMSDVVSRPILILQQRLLEHPLPLVHNPSRRVTTLDGDLPRPVLGFSAELASASAVASFPTFGSSGQALVAVGSEFEEGGAVADVESGEGLAGREGGEEGRRSKVDASGTARLRKGIAGGEGSGGRRSRSSDGSNELGSVLDGAGEASASGIELDGTARGAALTTSARGFTEGGEVEVGSSVGDVLLLVAALDASGSGRAALSSLLEVSAHDLREGGLVRIPEARRGESLPVESSEGSRSAHRP